jgi:hypothetical protein
LLEADKVKISFKVSAAWPFALIVLAAASIPVELVIDIV